jgi:putative NADH-flavin reductase
VVADDGSMSLSYEDFAMAIVDEIEMPHYVGVRFTVGY